MRKTKTVNSTEMAQFPPVIQYFSFTGKCSKLMQVKASSALKLNSDIKFTLYYTSTLLNYNPP